MNNNTENDKSPKEVNLIDYLLVLFQKRWLIIRNVGVITILSLIISLTIPKTYKSTATIIPVNLEGGGISSLLDGYRLDIFGRNVIIPETYRVILKSQSLRDSLISKFNLFEVYQAKYKEQIYKILDSNIEIEVDKEAGLGYTPIVGINLSVWSEDPQRATDIANFCVDYLREKVKDLNSQYVEKKFNFIENRYIQSLSDVRDAEQELKSFQDKYGLIEITEQMKALIQSLATLEAQKEQVEIELAIMATSVSTSNPAYQALKTKLDVLRNKLDELKDGDTSDSDESIIFYPTKQLPELSMKYFELYRNVQVKNKIYETMTVQFEQVRLQVDKDIPFLLVMDNARLPTYKAKPKRILIVLSGFLISVFISITYVFVMSFYMNQKSENSEFYKKMQEIGDMIRSDLKKIKVKK